MHRVYLCLLHGTSQALCNRHGTLDRNGQLIMDRLVQTKISIFFVTTMVNRRSAWITQHVKAWGRWGTMAGTYTEMQNRNLRVVWAQADWIRTFDDQINIGWSFIFSCSGSLAFSTYQTVKWSHWREIKWTNLPKSKIPGAQFAGNIALTLKALCQHKELCCGAIRRVIKSLESAVSVFSET